MTGICACSIAMTSQWSGQLQPGYHSHWRWRTAPPKTAPWIQLDWICFSGRLWPTQKEKPWTKLDYCLICTFILMTASLLILLFLLGFFLLYLGIGKKFKHVFKQTWFWWMFCIGFSVADVLGLFCVYMYDMFIVIIC